MNKELSDVVDKIKQANSTIDTMSNKESFKKMQFMISNFGLFLNTLKEDKNEIS